MKYSTEELKKRFLEKSIFDYVLRCEVSHQTGGFYVDGTKGDYRGFVRVDLRKVRKGEEKVVSMMGISRSGKVIYWKQYSSFSLPKGLKNALQGRIDLKGRHLKDTELVKFKASLEGLVDITI